MARELTALLRDGYADQPVVLTASAADHCSLAAPGGRTAVFVHPTYVDFDFDPEVSAKLVDWHGALNLVSASRAGAEEFVRVRATDLSSGPLRVSVLEAMPGSLLRSASRAPLAAAPPPRAKTVRTPATPRTPVAAKPEPETVKSWEALCDRCFMVHRVGVDC